MPQLYGIISIYYRLVLSLLKRRNLFCLVEIPCNDGTILNRCGALFLSIAVFPPLYTSMLFAFVPIFSKLSSHLHHQPSFFFSFQMLLPRYCIPLPYSHTHIQSPTPPVHPPTPLSRLLLCSSTFCHRGEEK